MSSLSADAVWSVFRLATVPTLEAKQSRTLFTQLLLLLDAVLVGVPFVAGSGTVFLMISDSFSFLVC